MRAQAQNEEDEPQKKRKKVFALDGSSTLDSVRSISKQCFDDAIDVDPLMQQFMKQADDHRAEFLLLNTLPVTPSAVIPFDLSVSSSAKPPTRPLPRKQPSK